MNLTIVNAVLNSHEIVRRQVLYWEKMPLPDGVEVILVDDGSDPPIECKAKNLKLVKTNNNTPWTQPAARNYGVSLASADYLMLTDIDHIIPKQTIRFILDNMDNYDVIRFKRQSAILDSAGNIMQDMDVLWEWGLKKPGLKLPPHGNSFAIRKGLYLGLGGVSEKLVGSGKYPNREESPFKRRLKRMGDRVNVLRTGKLKPLILHFPNGRFCGDVNYNPFGFFHTLKR